MLKDEGLGVTDSTKKRILVVEDDIQMVKFIQFKLNYMGYEVAGTADNCDQALERARMLQPDLILMDIMLEGSSDGIETAQKIVETQHVPIIYLTAHEDEELFERAKITEPFGYLIKPFNDRDLRIVIETSLHRHEQDKHVQKALQDVRDVLNSALDIMITFDFQGHIIEFNTAAERVFGLKRELARQESMLTLLRRAEDISEMLDGDPEATYRHNNLPFMDVEGKAFKRQILITPLKDSTGAVNGRLLVARAN